LILTSGALFVARRHTVRLFAAEIIAGIASPPQSSPRNRLHPMPKRHLIAWFLICSALILAPYWPTIVHGFFRYDDFALVSFTMTHNLAEAFTVPHDDHTLSLFRLQLKVLTTFFGVHPLPFNILLLGVFVLTLLLIVLLLRDVGVSSLGALLVLALFSGVAALGETISGYYSQMVHPETALLSLLAIWAYVRWEKTHHALLPPVVVAAMTVASFIDISGVWVPPAVLTFALCRHIAAGLTLKDFLATRVWIAAAVLGVLLLVACFQLYVFMVVAPGRFLAWADQAMPDNVPPSVTSILTQFFYLIAGGILLMTVFPIGYWHVPPWILLPLLIAALVIASWGGILVWRHMERAAKWHAASFLLILAGTSLMAVLARRYAGFDHAWPSKYIGTPYMWFCMTLGLLWQTLWNHTRARDRPLFLEATALGLVIFLALHAGFDRATSRIQPPGFGSGYLANIIDAKLRKEVLASLRTGFITPLVSQQPRGGVRLPTLDGVYLNEAYPSLAGFNNLSRYRPFIVRASENVTFVRNQAMQKGYSVAEDVVSVASLRRATDPVFVRALENDRYVQRLYLSSVPLAFARRSCDSHTPLTSPTGAHLTNARGVALTDSGALAFESTGATTLLIRDGAWDPERAHQAQLHLRARSHTNGPVRLEFHFSGALSIPYPRPWLDLAGADSECVTVDLLQLYAYALNPRVTRLTVRFPTPGRYEVLSVTLHATEEHGETTMKDAGKHGDRTMPIDVSIAHTLG
jgi:hypothetical protein